MIARARNLAACIARHRSLALLVAALALGLLAAFGARGYIAGQLAIERERLAPPQRMVSVVVAKRDLSRGDPVGVETMAVREMPEAYAPQGAVTPEQFEAVAGAVVAAPMRAGDPLLRAALSSPDAGGFSARVREGIRAMTIAVDEVNAISGMLQPGDRIDLLLSARLPGATGAAAQELSKPLLQDVVVLATGRQVRPGQDDRQGRGYTTITVEVQPGQAQKLVVAQRVGRLTALLRNPADRERMATTPIDVQALFDLKPAEAVAARRPAELIVGGLGTLRGTAAGGPALAPAIAPAASGPVVAPTLPGTPLVAPPLAAESQSAPAASPVTPPAARETPRIQMRPFERSPE